MATARLPAAPGRVAALLGGLLALLLAPPAPAAEPFPADYPVEEVLPEGGRSLGELEGEPPAAPVYRGQREGRGEGGGGKVVGYVFVTDQVVHIPAYSGKPVNMLVGMDTEGTITGAKVLHHEEPILKIGIPEHTLFDFAEQFAGIHATDHPQVGGGGDESVDLDGISGATVTVMAVNDTVMAAAREVARSRDIIAGRAVAEREPATIKTDRFAEKSWEELLGEGSIRRLHLTAGEVSKRFEEADVAEAWSGSELADLTGEDPFIELYYTYLNAPTVGRNLLGDSRYQRVMDGLAEGEHALLFMGTGPYSFKGSGYVRGGIFDRIRVEQGLDTITFQDLDHDRIRDIAPEGHPDFTEVGIFTIRKKFGFDPGSAWDLILRVGRSVSPTEREFVNFTARYQLPGEYYEAAEQPAAQAAGPMSTWKRVWLDKPVQIGILVAALTLLTAIMVFQEWLAKRPRVLFYVRRGFLLFTLLWIGWYALAQLSVVNVLTFVNALFGDFSWSTFLMDPLVFILWTFVAVSLLLWGRGVFCGWLCPFGALQDYANYIGRYILRLPQIHFPFKVHERLWAIKYVILLVLFGISLQSMSAAEKYAEVEPFKTAITMHFFREWGFVLYAGVLVVASAFQHKFYCRYLCPLGAALAIPARIRLFDWLKRHKECGTPCQICANECEVQAIHPEGHINPNECHFCLDCQSTYWNEYKCPPMVQRRKRRERGPKAREKAKEMEEALGYPASGEEYRVKPVDD
ncbi:NosR/NirI family protein [Thiohalorhabdus denitrificans]|uniref:NosR/NirI family transcriptional regulator, nitrous oxide reductase regulator n=1 Tax=Thiohalorhabdus denitrificans TaxID=381306 RepID=A0A1G5HK24_9GAMM|nr:NosR/NirI family protein [Thiohalorhabdus denitrificans]SCY64054.1 NosR/NirI family transcriptional regulator, nitrous oxide reductase regulator [Thiohalorhabdus denitrificans]